MAMRKLTVASILLLTLAIVLTAADYPAALRDMLAKNRVVVEGSSGRLSKVAVQVNYSKNQELEAAFVVNPKRTLKLTPVPTDVSQPRLLIGYENDSEFIRIQAFSYRPNAKQPNDRRVTMTWSFASLNRNVSLIFALTIVNWTSTAPRHPDSSSDQQLELSRFDHGKRTAYLNARFNAIDGSMYNVIEGANAWVGERGSQITTVSEELRPIILFRDELIKLTLFSDVFTTEAAAYKATQTQVSLWPSAGGNIPIFFDLGRFLVEAVGCITKGILTDRIAGCAAHTVGGWIISAADWVTDTAYRDNGEGHRQMTPSSDGVDHRSYPPPEERTNDDSK